MKEIDTKTAILSAAELAFAERGFEATSVRHIVAAAGVNLAAVHYHFGSKEALIEAVFSHRLGPINSRRLERLTALEESDHAPPLEEVVRALVEPVLELAGTDATARENAMRLYGRVVAEPSVTLQGMLRRQFGHVVQRFTAAFARALPDLPHEVLMWRLYFSVGAMAHVMADPARLKTISEGTCDPADSEQVSKQLIAYVTSGFRAGLPPSTTLPDTNGRGSGCGAGVPGD